MFSALSQLMLHDDLPVPEDSDEQPALKLLPPPPSTGAISESA
jgi:hypothetical protein